MDEDRPQSLVALRDRREQVIEWLSDRFASDHLGEDEFERRVDLAYQATSVAALDELVSDLEVSEDEEQVQPSEALVPWVNQAQIDNRPEFKSVTAVMGGVERKGRWVVACKMRVVAVMGGIELDMREAILPPGITEIHVTAIMGGVEITVPPHVSVQTEGMALLGGFEELHRAPAVPDPNMPVLVVKGLALMGGVEIKTRLPGESGWQAWKRRRRERKALASGQGPRPPRQLGE
ncbi:DUF1707 SHOCT-like domain-containing protein [Haliangium sp.]|uniref:DUF1707 SHOCT-like domain-containing protein n=1 Tax=Haliangium sp. TaxID=2663208 RepID=UPI003D11809F